MGVAHGFPRNACWMWWGGRLEEKFYMIVGVGGKEEGEAVAGDWLQR